MSITFVKKQSRLKNREKLFLLYKICFLTFFFSFSFESYCQSGREEGCYRLVFWNVENLFDIWDDTTKNDDDFTPRGENHWTKERYTHKLTNIYKTLAALGQHKSERFDMPWIVGMAEVENDKVLRDLCSGTPLRRHNYGYIHFESPDKRGIDNAILYRKDKYRPLYSKAINVSDSTKDYYTRDILLVNGVTSYGDTLIVLVNHFPSKRGGAAAVLQRQELASILRYTMDTLLEAHPCTGIVVMGDFNASPDEPEIAKTLMKRGNKDYLNLMSMVESGKGSHKYQGNWSCLDQIIVSSTLWDTTSCARMHVAQRSGQIFDAPFLLIDDERYMGKKVFRTYIAMKYQGGYSDHLPVFIDIKTVNKN